MLKKGREKEKEIKWGGRGGGRENGKLKKHKKRESEREKEEKEEEVEEKKKHCAKSIYKRNLHQLVGRNGRGSCRGVGTQRARPRGEAVMSAGLINRPAISNGMLS